MIGSTPLTANAMVFAFCGTFLALVLFMTLQRFVRELLVAKLLVIGEAKSVKIIQIARKILPIHLTLAGQFGGCLFDGQITGCCALGDFHTAIGACGNLIT